MVDLLQTLSWFSALAVGVYLLAINPAVLRKIPSDVGKWLRYYSRVITVILIAWVVYGIPQIRELLPVYGPSTPFSLLKRINTDGWSGLWAYISRLEDLTTIVVTLTLAVSPVVRPAQAYSWEELQELATQLIPNLLVACLFPAVIGYHAAFAISPDLSIWSGLWAGVSVYLQWVITYALVTVVLSSFYWIPELLKATPADWDLGRTLQPLLAYIYLAGIISALIIFGASSLSALAVVLFPVSVAVRLVSESGLGDYPHSALTVTNLFIAAVIGLLKLDEFLIARTRCSMLITFLLTAAIMAFFDLNDSHRIRELTVADAGRPNRDLVESFQNWQSERHFDTASKPYPIYIVAAQGGGMYAAYHSAQFLAAAEDIAPEFSKHLFAISGVSGGALGAATFSSLVLEAESAAIAPDEDWFQSHTDALLGQDYLTATVWTTLFTDPWSRVMPCVRSVCPGNRLSRANTFERTLERAWQNTFPHRDTAENPFLSSVHDQWSPIAGTPALLLNTTEVETGEGVVISSAGSLNDNSNATIRWLSQRAPQLDIRLSTAVGLSARFPGLAPAGWYEVAEDSTDRNSKRRLVDGGYYDNSGVTTALSVIAALKPYANNGRFVLISLNSITESALAPVSAGGLSEIMSPLKTLESTRSARARLAVEQAFVALDGETCIGPLTSSQAPCVFTGAMRTTTLATEHPAPLGWQLSKASREAIRKSVGNADDCADLRPDDETLLEHPNWARVVKAFRIHNSCMLAQIRAELAE